MQSAPEHNSGSRAEQILIRSGGARTYPDGAVRRLVCATLGLSLASMASAQSGSSDSPRANTPEAASPRGVLEEVVVTATRREEKLSNVPASITAITSQSIDTLGIKDFNDVARFTPGVAIDTSGTNTIAIRGISASAGASTTGVYIDDTPIQMRALGGEPDQALPKSFDLERVEVLRGPQGTLFGAGSEGGTVRYILTQPSDTVTSTYARSEISYTRNGGQSYEAGVAHGGPIIQNELGFRASAWFRQDGGWIDRYDPYTGTLVDPNSNRQGTLMLRAALLWQPISNLTITPSVLYQNRKRHNVGLYWGVFSDPQNDHFGTGSVTPQIEPDRYYLPMLKVQYDLGSMQLISNTSYYNRHDLSGYDGSATFLAFWQTQLPGPIPFYPPSSPYYPLVDNRGIHLPASLRGYTVPALVTNNQQNFTQELRLQSNDPSSPLTWTAGVYFESNRSLSREEGKTGPLETQFDTTLFGTPPTTAFGTPMYGEPFLPNGDIFSTEHRGRDQQIAGFGEVTYRLGPVTFIAGGRVSHVKFDHDSLQLEAFPPPMTVNSGTASATPFTPRLGLQYHIDPDNMVYATYSTGFRQGGSNAPFPTNVGCEPSEALIGKMPPLSYGPDKVKSYEIGHKDSLFGNRVRLANSLYYIKWNDIQQNVYLASCQLQYTDNVGTAVSKGADIQADFLLVPGLTLETTAGYNSAYFTKSAPGNTVVAGDAVAGFAQPLPTWTATVGLQYVTQVLEHESFVRFDWEYHGVNNRPPPTRDPNSGQYTPDAFNLPATRFASLRAGTHFGDWEIDAFVDNLFDTHTIINYAQIGGDLYNFLPGDPAAPKPLNEYFGFQPRTVGVTVTFRQ